MDSNPVLRQIKLPAGENGVMQPEKYASYVTSKVSVPNGFCNLVSVEAQEADPFPCERVGSGDDTSDKMDYAFPPLFATHKLDNEPGNKATCCTLTPPPLPNLRSV